MPETRFWLVMLLTTWEGREGHQERLWSEPVMGDPVDWFLERQGNRLPSNPTSERVMAWTEMSEGQYRKLKGIPDGRDLEEGV